MYMCTVRRQDEDSTQYTYQHNRLICHHTIDYVTIDVHKKTIYITLAKHWGTP
jgi:hypothetical protein